MTDAHRTKDLEVSPSPQEQAWQDFAAGKVGRATFTDSVREAFNAGMDAGIRFTMDQIGWTLQDRAKGIDE